MQLIQTIASARRGVYHIWFGQMRTYPGYYQNQSLYVCACGSHSKDPNGFVYTYDGTQDLCTVCVVKAYQEGKLGVHEI